MFVLLPPLWLIPMLLLPPPLVRIDGAIVPELLEKLDPLLFDEPDEDELDLLVEFRTTRDSHHYFVVVRLSGDVGRDDCAATVSRRPLRWREQACASPGAWSVRMPRVARVVVAGMAHHVTQRGNNRQDIFLT